MGTINKVILVGYVGKSPEVKTLGNSSKVASFSLATSESWKDKTTGEKKESTEWHNVQVWRGLADVAEKYVNKGDLLYIEGKLKTRSWEKDGVTKYVTEVVADAMTMLSSNKAKPATQPMESSGHRPADNSTDDLPF